MKIASPRSALSFLFLLAAIPAMAKPELLGVGSIPGTARDESGHSATLQDGITPNDRAGAFGSAIAYSGSGDLYYAAPDRGPADGATTYSCRLYALRIAVTPNPAGGWSVTPAIEKTTLLRRDPRHVHTGSIAAFDAADPANSLRLDPEGLRVDKNGGSVFLSDEYGPGLYEFGLADGVRRRALPVPASFHIASPSADPNAELSQNTSGRQANRGMEGLAISPDGSRLYGLMQSPLIQDRGLDPELKRAGTNARLLEIDIASGAVREFLYYLSDKGYGLNEILAIDDHQFLVIERDGKAGAEAVAKRIMKVDIAGATDIHGVANLPQGGIPYGITPISKDLFIDMLDPAYGLADMAFPEKIEGLAFGPDLPDGRHLLIVTSDNDFLPAQETKIFAFAIDPGDLPGFQAQQIAPR